MSAPIRSHAPARPMSPDRPRTRPRRRRLALGLAAAVLLVLATACASGGKDDQVARNDVGTVPGTDDSATTAPSNGDDPGTATDDDTDAGSRADQDVVDANVGRVQPADPKCRPGPGKTVEQVADLEIPEQTLEGVDAPAEQIGKYTVPAVHVPDVRIPAQTIDGGCKITYDAPAGCLPKIEITGVSLPSVSIPGYRLDHARVGSDVFQGTSVPGEQVDGDQAKGEVVGQECQEKKPVGGTQVIPGVIRTGVIRGGIIRASTLRASSVRPPLCTQVDGLQKCSSMVTVPAVVLKAQTMPAATFPSATIATKVLTGTDTKILEGEKETSFVTPDAVLFDFDKSDLKPEATPTLEAIKAEIDKLPSDAKVTVEGHTDDKGADDYNQKLSEDRAEAVTTWIEEHGVAADRITTKGYGEKAPTAPNDTDANRAKNRRVVIGVQTG